MLTLAAVLVVLMGAAAPVLAAGASNQVVNTSFNAYLLLPNGDPVDVMGTLHNVFHEFETPSGTVHYLCHYNFEDVHGTNLVTGTHYELVGARTHTSNFDLKNGQSEYTISYQYQLVGQGTGPTSSSATWIMKFVEHLTINANGTVTVYFDHPILTK